MTRINESFVIDSKGNKIGVFLPIKEYNKMKEELEDIEDIKAYDKVMGRKQEFIPLDQALKEIEAGRKKESNVSGCN